MRDKVDEIRKLLGIFGLGMRGDVTIDCSKSGGTEVHQLVCSKIGRKEFPEDYLKMLQKLKGVSRKVRGFLTYRNGDKLFHGHLSRTWGIEGSDGHECPKRFSGQEDLLAVSSVGDSYR